MQNLLREKVAFLIPRRQPLDEFAISRDRAERRRIILARRREKLRSHPVMRSAENHDQLRPLAREQLAVRVRIRGAAPTRVDMRRNQSRQSRAIAARRGNRAGRARARKVAGDLGAQAGRIIVICQSREGGGTLRGARKCFVNLAHPIGVAR